MTTFLSVLFVGVFAILSYSTELVTQSVNGDFGYVFTSYNNMKIGAEPQTKECAKALRASG